MSIENEEVSETALDDAPEYLNMSDEDMMNMTPPEPTQAVEAPASVSAAEVPGTAGEATEESDTPEVTPDEPIPEAEDTPEQVAKDVPAASEPEGSDVGEEVKDTKESPAETVDYKAEYQKLLAPFKANGREITIKSVDDAVALMQMGANYNKKMAALKPNLKLLKLLENNGLLDAQKLSYLIDLEKKDPKAITKLVKDSGMDPLDLSFDEESAYKPTVQTVDDRELELDAVLDELQGTESYNRTLKIVSQEWDGKSKQVIADTPQLLKVINSHVQSGIYDLISNEIESERTFGRLQGLSDLEAYRQVGDRLNEVGAFNHLVQQNPRQQTPKQPVIVPPKPKMGNDDKLREKRRAASATQAASPSKAQTEFNPLSLSDDEFAKLVQPRFL